MITREDELMLEAYLERELTSDIKLEVEFRLQSDAEFRAEYLLRKGVQYALASETLMATLRERVLNLV